MSQSFISKAVGIDLGTTNSAVAVMDLTDAEILLHRDQTAKRETTPSCVWKDPKSGEIVVGHKAYRRIGSHPAPVRSIKRLMGRQSTVRLTDEDVTPEKVSSLILQEMKRQIEEDVAALSSNSTQWMVDRAIVTVPAYFDQPQIEATLKAGEMSGLQVFSLLHEPTAAACYHCWSNQTKNGVFLVYDFGGGTFDVSILRSTAGKFEVLGISGNNMLGGDDLDMILAEHLLERLRSEDYALDLDPKNDPEDRLRLDSLKLLAEGVKKGLSYQDEFILRDTGTLRDKEGTQVVIETLFERREIDSIIKPVVERTLPYCFDALEKAQERAGIRLADVDQIILAGGSTHIPLVREMVRQHLCCECNSNDLIVDERARQPRAKCAAPYYEKVDTIVALGAAIRAAVEGGLAFYNAEKTVRVTFRGTSSTSDKHITIGGELESLDSLLDLKGGQIKLTIPDAEFEDIQDLTDGKTFGFKRVPLQPSAENLLNFEIYDANGRLVATAGRPVTQNKEAARPTGGVAGTAVLSKAIHLMVEKAGKPYRKELFAALQTLPKTERYTFSHPGKTEVVLLPVYQRARLIKEIRVPVPTSITEGAPVEIEASVDHTCQITLKGRIAEVEFNVTCEIPPDRGEVTTEQVMDLENKLQEITQYMPPGQRSILEAKFKKAKMSLDSAQGRGAGDQALHEFEEMEALIAENARVGGPLQPPKEDFDQVIAKCVEWNQLLAEITSASVLPYDSKNAQKTIETYRDHGEKAYATGNQKDYGDAFAKVENLQSHLAGLLRKYVKDTRTEEQKAADSISWAREDAVKVCGAPGASAQPDLLNRVQQIQSQLNQLESEIGKNPGAARMKADQLRAQLDQINTMLNGSASGTKDGVLVREH